MVGLVAYCTICDGGSRALQHVDYCQTSTHSLSMPSWDRAHYWRQRTVPTMNVDSSSRIPLLSVIFSGRLLHIITLAVCKLQMMFTTLSFEGGKGEGSILNEKAYVLGSKVQTLEMPPCSVLACAFEWWRASRLDLFVDNHNTQPATVLVSQCHRFELHRVRYF